MNSCQVLNLRKTRVFTLVLNFHRQFSQFVFCVAQSKFSKCAHEWGGDKTLFFVLINEKLGLSKKKKDVNDPCGSFGTQNN